MTKLTAATMKRDGRYNWKNQFDRLIYLGKAGSWHQFKKVGDPRAVWCEVLDEDLHMLEETACELRMDDSSAQPELALRCQTCGSWRSTPCKWSRTQVRQHAVQGFTCKPCRTPTT